MYARLSTSLRKQDPPKPTDACSIQEPILLSEPAANATSLISAPVASHTALRALMLLIRCARSALAASFANSEDQRFV